MTLDIANRNTVRRFARFGVLSVFSFVASLGLTVLFVEVFAFNPLPAHVLTLVVVFFLNFIGLIGFVFPGSTGNLLHAFLSFLVSTLGFRILEWIAFALLVTIGTVDYRLAIIVVVPVFAAMKFIFLNQFTFQEKNRRVHAPR